MIRHTIHSYPQGMSLAPSFRNDSVVSTMGRKCEGGLAVELEPGGPSST